MNKFYRLFSTEYAKDFRCFPNIVDGVNYYEYNSKQILRGDFSRIRQPPVFEEVEYSGSIFSDIIGYTNEPYFISDKLRKIFEQAKITGWVLNESKVLRSKKKDYEEISGYNGISIIGKCDTNLPLSHYFTSEQLTDIAFKGEMLFLDKNGNLEGWDGSDIFIPINNSSVMVSERLYKILKREKIKRISLKEVRLMQRPQDYL